MATILSDSTSQAAFVDIRDTSGNPLTGLAYDTAGLTAYATADLSTSLLITLVQLASVEDPWTEGGFIEIDAVKFPGLYRLDVPNWIFSGSHKIAAVTVYGAASMEHTTIFYEILNVGAQIFPLLTSVVGAAVQATPIDGTYVLGDYLIIIAAAVASKLSGAEGNTLTFRDILDSYDVLRATVDANGNRTAIELFPA